jgi:hypothetical protein
VGSTHLQYASGCFAKTHADQRFIGTYFLILAYSAKPIVPSASPATEAPQLKKFRKKVEGRILRTIKKGRHFCLQVARPIAILLCLDQQKLKQVCCYNLRLLKVFEKENGMSAPKILEIRPLKDYKIWIKFDDGKAGEVDLSHLAGQGVFALWKDNENFKKVSVENGRSLVWADEIDIDADSLYLKLTGKSPEELFPALKEESSYA